MKRILVLFVAAILYTTPAFAAGAAHNATQGGGIKGGEQSKVVNVTTVKNAAVIASGKNSEANIGNVTNEGGKQSDVVNVTTLKNSAVIANDGGKTNIGNVTNK